MIDRAATMSSFISHVRALQGDEKGEVQVFCDRLFRAFGHDGYKEAGAILEECAPWVVLRWNDRLLLHMKKRGERLGSPRIYHEVYDAWQSLAPNKPKYVILCNFDEFWIYELKRQFDEPVARLPLVDLPNRWTALHFLSPKPEIPQFDNDRHAPSKATATKLGDVFRAMVRRGETPERAQRFTLQCAVAMFAEDTDLLPRGLFSELVSDCLRGQRADDLLGGLFRQMNSTKSTTKNRFQNIPHFHLGLFSTVDSIDLTGDELSLLARATDENWSRIHPGIFGTLFQATMNENERHERGAHYTPEAAIFEHVVRPTLIKPWRNRIREASTLKDLLVLRDGLTKIRVLDPACGSGNFLYVAYRELKRLEWELLEKIHECFSAEKHLEVRSKAAIRTNQFFGMDTDPFAVELAKVTLVFAQTELGLDMEQPLPLDNLDDNICCIDALFCPWPKADVILGNPPFQSKNKMQKELGADYVQRVRARYPDVPGRADYCVYWFRRAHDELAPGAAAGLVGTNTIRQNYSREGGLDYIVNNGGTITEAVGSMVWPGEAVVHVSVVNWIKGSTDGVKKLSWQEGDDRDSPWVEKTLSKIPSSLSAAMDVTGAKELQTNAQAKACYQGQTHGHEGFLLSPEEAGEMIAASKAHRDVIFPFLIGEDLLSNVGGKPSRWVIDFHPREQLEARQYKLPFQRIKTLVLPDRELAALEEKERNAKLTKKGNKHHENFLKNWWLLSYPRGELMTALTGISRYVVCSRVTKRPVFAFVSSRIHPNDALSVFPMEDDYSFGILQSGVHWAWFKARCSTLKGDWRYTSKTVFDSFPWPQAPTEKQCLAVAKAAVALRAVRREIAAKHKMTLRTMYASMEDPGKHPLKDAHAALDEAVRAAYGMPARKDPLTFLLELNLNCAAKEAKSLKITGPGLPANVSLKSLMTKDAIERPTL